LCVRACMLLSMCLSVSYILRFCAGAGTLTGTWTCRCSGTCAWVSSWRSALRYANSAVFSRRSSHSHLAVILRPRSIDRHSCHSHLTFMLTLVCWAWLSGSDLHAVHVHVPVLPLRQRLARPVCGVYDVCRRAAAYEQQPASQLCIFAQPPSRLRIDHVPCVRAPDASQTKQLFQDADVDGSGHLDLEEVGEMMTNMLGKPLDPAELKRVQMEMDADGDGLIDFAEFRGWIASPSGKLVLGAAAASATAGGRCMTTELTRILEQRGEKSIAEAERSRGGAEDPDFLLPPEVERTPTYVSALRRHQTSEVSHKLHSSCACAFADCFHCGVRVGPNLGFSLQLCLRDTAQPLGRRSKGRRMGLPL
jgi:hypothetical protein